MSNISGKNSLNLFKFIKPSREDCWLYLQPDLQVHSVIACACERCREFGCYLIGKA
jgi:hypothetical protein